MDTDPSRQLLAATRWQPLRIVLIAVTTLVIGGAAGFGLGQHRNATPASKVVSLSPHRVESADPTPPPVTDTITFCGLDTDKSGTPVLRAFKDGSVMYFTVWPSFQGIHSQPGTVFGVEYYIERRSFYNGTTNATSMIYHLQHYAAVQPRTLRPEDCKK